MNEEDLIGKTIEKIDIDGYGVEIRFTDGTKTIEKIDIDGYGVEIRFTDGTKFVYNASDTGFSYWNISKGDEVE